VPQVVSIFGVSQAGGVFVPINGQLFPEQVAHIANDCRMKALVTSKAKLASLTEVLKDIPSVEFLVVAGDGESPAVALPAHVFEELCRPAAEDPPDVGIGKDLAAILYTSGSTGKPKGAMLSHANLMAGSSIVSTYLSAAEETPA